MGRERVAGVTTTSRHISLGLGAPRDKGARGEASRPSAGRTAPAQLSAAWEISPDALRRATWAHATLNGEAARLEKAALVWNVELDGRAQAELVLTLTRAERRVIHLTGEINASVLRDGAFLHVDAPQVKITAREREGEWDVVYAWTTLLAAPLHLPGGVYEKPTRPPPHARDE